MFLQPPPVFAGAGPFKQLDQQTAAGFQRVPAKIMRRLGQRHAARLIAGPDTAQIGGQVGNNKVRARPAELFKTSLPHRLIAKVARDKRHAVQRLHRPHINGNDPAARADPLTRVLRPAAGRGPEVNHMLTGLKQPGLAVNLLKFIDRARAIMRLPRAPAIWIPPPGAQPLPIRAVCGLAPGHHL